MSKIKTVKLLQLVMNNPGKIYEARLLINKSFTATHFISASPNERETIIDEGIDGEMRKLKWVEFFCDYHQFLWVVDEFG